MSGFCCRDGVHIPQSPLAHREDEYDPAGFASLAEMQEKHFWYRGRHRFVHHIYSRLIRRCRAEPEGLHAIDLGGGCGGWVRYLGRRQPGTFAELALADSSLEALVYARQVCPPEVALYQVDLMHLPWQEHWDVIFALDVLEHLPDDAGALRQIAAALAPGGLAILTMPALKLFWTWNDRAVGHQRRYARRDLCRLAAQAGLELVTCRYFMFLLSPLLLVSRWARQPDLDALNREQIRELIGRTHRVPAAPVNALLAGVFGCETPLGHHLAFPWGTSILAVLQKPLTSSAGKR